MLNKMNRLRIKAAETLGGDPDVLFAYLFGSLARNQITPVSDIDIAVYLEQAADPVHHKLDLLGRLMDQPGTEAIDLVVLNTASLLLKARVIRDGQVLLDRKPHLRHLFESRVLREYFDFSIFEEAILKRRFLLG